MISSKFSADNSVSNIFLIKELTELSVNLYHVFILHLSFGNKKHQF
ncbi:hypothetical protein E34_0504 [Lactococcus lactis subsp. lactis]|uniref:Uncharacterized protein n=1 Tax=Lactococcus lactis subsp. lactis TaxID=1360 RepID=A0A0V8ATP2_LACLL|nr:hypothetical protein E34_0504 [Lactococcus lactis subsp. lactis]KSU20079.1 hypothetical protein M20_1681 [Lactococcus lactis subsp. lactis]